MRRRNEIFYCLSIFIVSILDSHAVEIKFDVYLIDTSILCRDAKSYKRCPSFNSTKSVDSNGTKNDDGFIPEQKSNDVDYATFVLKEEIKSKAQGNNKFFFKALNDYKKNARNDRSQENLKSAFFVFHIEEDEVEKVRLIRKGKHARKPSPSFRSGKFKRFIDHMEATNLHHENSVQFSFDLNDRTYEFRFVK